MTEEPELMSGTSIDIAADKRGRLKQLFPTVFTEMVDATGKLVESVDFEKLKAELGTFTDLFENRRERYGMDWPGKKEALKLIQTVSTATLKPCREESVNFDTTENLFIEGDNLEVLKLLQKSYYGKVKMIYIDPPYNTGNEFIYPDNYSETLETYLEYAGLVDGEGKKFSTNTANEGRFHTKWLNMMYPRLYLAWNMLVNNGVIFISIDDNEFTNLKKLCDEIFGEDNCLGNLVWQHSLQPKGYTGKFSVHHNFVLCYQKGDNFELANIDRTEEHNKNYSNPDNDPNGKWRAGDVRNALYRPNLIYKITTPSGNIIDPPHNGWRWSKETVDEKLKSGEIIFSSDEKRIIRKIYLNKLDGRTPETILFGKDVGTTRDATSEIKNLFDGVAPFDTPKPTRLIQHCMSLAGVKEDDIILDFFAGSATTAHAVLGQNQRDNDNRKFILVQLPEPCPDDSEAFKTGYKTIADIGKERIRRVIKKLEATENGKLSFDSTSSQDWGFKVLKLDKSNFKQWQSIPPDTTPETLVKQLKLFIEHIDAKASPEDLLYEILIKAGFPPSERIETLTLAGKTVYSVSGGGLLLCLEDEVSAELVNAVAEAEPMQFICLDAAFGGNDQLKANAVQTFAARNMGKEKHNQTVFKTV